MFRFVAIDTNQICASIRHMNINIGRRMEHTFFQIAVFYVVAAAAEEVANAAIIACRASDALRYSFQIHIWSWRSAHITAFNIR